MIKHSRAIRIAVTFCLAVVLIVLSACSGGRKTVATSGSDRSAMRPANNGPSVSYVSGLEPREALALANAWKTDEPGVTSYVDTRTISFEFPDGTKTSVPLPDARMVVAVAPYIHSTHPCEIHYMSGCQGEIVNTPVKVYGTTADGLVVVDDTLTTMENGFFELWLARDLDIQLTVEYEGMRASRVISTKDGSNTCITTMRLL